MARILRIAAIVLLALFAVAVATWWAGEQTEVVRLRTRDAGGASHETKRWVVDHDGPPWVRVANPRRGWYQRLLENPHVSLIRGIGERAMIAHPQDTPEARAALDRAFREKYRRTDWWYGVLLRHHAIPIRLDPDPEGV